MSRGVALCIPASAGLRLVAICGSIDRGGRRSTSTLYRARCTSSSRRHLFAVPSMSYIVPTTLFMPRLLSVLLSRVRPLTHAMPYSLSTLHQRCDNAAPDWGIHGARLKQQGRRMVQNWRIESRNTRQSYRCSCSVLSTKYITGARQCSGSTRRRRLAARG